MDKGGCSSPVHLNGRHDFCGEGPQVSVSFPFPSCSTAVCSHLYTATSWLWEKAVAAATTDRLGSQAL